MFLNADELPDGTLLQGFDICVVGTGAAGIPLARRLIGSSKKVLMLSSGRPSDRGRPAEYRQSIYRGTLGPFMAKVDSIFLERSRLHIHGGTTNHFGFWSLPLAEAFGIAVAILQMLGHIHLALFGDPVEGLKVRAGAVALGRSRKIDSGLDDRIDPFRQGRILKRWSYPYFKKWPPLLHR